jgi:pimeloyl-ACP methyl ester carboxylesterase
VGARARRGDAGDRRVSSVTVAGRRVELARIGSGEPLLYLHGLADVHSALPPDPPTRLLHRLASSAAVVAPALPGYAGSDGLGPRADVEDHAFHLVDLLDEIGIGPVDVVGASFGGWLAAEFALRHPTRVRRLVLAAPLGLHVRDAPGALFFGAAAPRGVGGFGEVRGVLFADPDGPVALDALPDELPPERALRWFGGLGGAAALGWRAPQLCDPKLAGRLDRIGMPTLVVWGADDRVAPVGQATAWQRGLPDARLEVVGGAGHALSLEEPDRLAQLASDFLH